jgi:hypothetical protein
MRCSARSPRGPDHAEGRRNRRPSVRSRSGTNLDRARSHVSASRSNQQAPFGEAEFDVELTQEAETDQTIDAEAIWEVEDMDAEIADSEAERPESQQEERTKRCADRTSEEVADLLVMRPEGASLVEGRLARLAVARHTRGPEVEVVLVEPVDRQAPFMHWHRQVFGDASASSACFGAAILSTLIDRATAKQRRPRHRRQLLRGRQGDGGADPAPGLRRGAASPV